MNININMSNDYEDYNPYKFEHGLLLKEGGENT